MLRGCTVESTDIDFANTTKKLLWYPGARYTKAMQRSKSRPGGRRLRSNLRGEYKSKRFRIPAPLKVVDGRPQA